MVNCENLVKIYKTDELEVLALQGLNLHVAPGEMLAVIGASGSGKSTLMNMLGGLDKASAGRLFVNGQNLFKMNAAQLCEYRQKTVGFVWQNASRNLVPYLSAIDNICLPMIERNRRKKTEYAEFLLKHIGLQDRKHHSLAELSGGQQQRIALGIALANRPQLLLADEPTGALDSASGDQVLALLKSINQEFGTTIIIVTHDRELSRRVSRIVSIRDGQVSSEFRKRSYRDELDSLPHEREEEHKESIVMDKAGRIQLPREYFESLKKRGIGRLYAEEEENGIRFKPVEDEQE